MQSIAQHKERMDCFVAALLGRNWGSERRPPQSKLSSPGLTRRSSTPRPLDLSQTPLEYWVARSSRAMTAVFVSSIRVGPKAGTQLAMTANPDTTSRSRGAMRPSCACLFRPIEGAGNAGRPMRPIAACAMIVVGSTRVSQVTPESPGIPHAMVYGLFRALPGDRAFLPPSPAELLPPT
jgi:hypothetical protein